MGVLVTDFDGVLRLWPPSAAFASRLEAAHGLASGSLLAALQSGGLEGSLVRGEISRRQWREQLRRRVGRGAADAWCARPTTIDGVALRCLGFARAAGLRVVMFSNGSDELEHELVDAGLLHAFDRVYNSAVLGAAKPDRAAYDLVTQLEETGPGGLVLLDDRAENVAGATSAGWQAVKYEKFRDLRRAIASAGSV